MNARNDNDFEGVFTTIVRDRIGALIVSPDALFTSRRSDLLRWQPIMRCLRSIICARRRPRAA
jgi:hypothetical protein